MLYTSSKRITALKECRPKQGDLVYLSQWMGNSQISVNKLLDEKEDAAFLERLDDYNHIFHGHIDSLFTRRIHEDYSADYKLSAAITEILTSNFPADEHTGDGGSIGFRYPSIFDKKGSYNTAFPADAYVDKLHTNHVVELLIGQPDGSSMPVRVLDTAFELSDGTIKWTGSSKFLPVLRDNGSVLFRYDGKRWNVEVRDEDATEADIRDLLHE